VIDKKEMKKTATKATTELYTAEAQTQKNSANIKAMY